MQTGQYYYDQMPLYYRRQFKKECKRQGYKFRNIMISECYGFHHLIAFDWHSSVNGMEFWHLVAQNRFDELDLNRPFARWFKSNHTVQFINKNAIALVTIFFLLAIAGLSIAFAVAGRSEQEKQMLKNELSRRDSIIRAAARIDSIKTDMIGQRPSFDEMRKGWEPNGIITRDSANAWMDKVMDENKIPGK